MVDFKDRLIAAVRVLHEIATAFGEGLAMTNTAIILFGEGLAMTNKAIILFGEGLAMTNTAIILLGECLLSALNDALLKTYFKSLFSV